MLTQLIKQLRKFAPSKESTFSEILISAVKTILSHSNQHKNIKELLQKNSLKICCSPYTASKEAIEVQNKFLARSSNFEQNGQHLRMCVELKFQILATYTITKM